MLREFKAGRFGVTYVVAEKAFDWGGVQYKGGALFLRIGRLWLWLGVLHA
jgi:hypothetical protein